MRQWYSALNPFLGLTPCLHQSRGAASVCPHSTQVRGPTSPYFRVSTLGAHLLCASLFL